MLKIRFNSDAAKSRLNKIAAGLAAMRPQILDECGTELVGLARIYFDNLSQGGSSFTGRRWRPPAASTVAKRKALARRGKLRAPASVQGIVTGAMQRSLRAETTANSVSISYADPAAYWFNIHRRLIPSRLPRPWRQSLDTIVQTHVDQVSKGDQ